MTVFDPTYIKRMRSIARVAEPYLYLVPTVVGLLLFSAGAVVGSLLISFSRWDIITSPEWVGVENYRLMFRSELFWTVFWNTWYFTLLYVPLTILTSLALALLVNQRLKGIAFFRTVYFFPVVSSMIAVALVWSWMYNPEYGLLNYLLKSLFGIQGPAWLADSGWAMPAMVLVAVWKTTGYCMVIFLAGLQGIPDELYEAAGMDGAGKWAQFRNVTLPMLSPTMFFVLVITLINSFQVFEQTYVMTKGGPANATMTLSFFIYQNVFQFFKMGYAAAMSYVLFAIIAVITFAQFRLQKRWVFFG